MNPSMRMVDQCGRKETQVILKIKVITYKNKGDKMNCLSLLYFWCKQDVMGDIEDLVDFIGKV